MDQAYLLWHVHALPNANEDVKLVGVYSSEEAAEAAKQRVAGQPGFRDLPEGFEISVYDVNKDHWTEGFVTVEPIHIRLLDEGTDAWTPVVGQRVGPMTFKIVAPPDYDPEDEKWEFVPGTTVLCEERTLSEGPVLVAVRLAPAPPPSPASPPQ